MGGVDNNIPHQRSRKVQRKYFYHIHSYSLRLCLVRLSVQSFFLSHCWSTVRQNFCFHSPRSLHVTVQTARGTVQLRNVTTAMTTNNMNNLTTLIKRYVIVSLALFQH